MSSELEQKAAKHLTMLEFIEEFLKGRATSPSDFLNDRSKVALEHYREVLERRRKQDAA